MVRLMEIYELNQVLDITPESFHEEYQEILPHLNVYVSEKEGSICAYAYIVDGYIIGGIHKSDGAKDSDIIELITFIKSRYSELVYAKSEGDDSYKDVLLALDFALESTEMDEESGQSYEIYSWEEQ